MLAKEFTSKTKLNNESLKDINGDANALELAIENKGKDFLKSIVDFITSDINSNDSYYEMANNAYSSMRNPWFAIIKYDINGEEHELQLSFNSDTFSIDCKLDGKYIISLQDLNDEFFTYEDYVDNGYAYDEMAYDYLVIAIEKPNHDDDSSNDNELSDSDFDGFI